MTPERRAFASATGPVTVAVTVPEALRVLGAVFPDDRVAAAGGTPSITLDAHRDGYLLRTPLGEREIPGLHESLVALELALAEELVRRSGLPGLHAGGAVIAGGAVLFPGDGGRGKSSLTAALARTGVPVLGDDVVLLDVQGCAHPFRRLLKVEEPARSLLDLPEAPEPLRSIWPDSAFYRPTQLGSRWADPAPVREIVRPSRVDGATTELAPVRAAALLPELLTGVVLSDRIAPGAFDAVASALGEARCWDLRYGTTAEGASALLEAFG